MITWSCKNFAELSNEEVYKILQLRIEVFAVEQNVVYQDCDDKDQHCYHLTAWDKNDLIAYSRLLPPGLAYKDPSVGREVTAGSARGKNIGRELMTRSIKQIYILYGRHSITISAQLYLTKFYKSLGFEIISDPYLEDSIEHIKMLLKYRGE